MEAHRDIKRNYSWPQWLLWFTGIILFPASLVFAFYGPVAYIIVNDARQEKIDKEEAMQLEWLELRQANLTEDLEQMDFVYSDTFNTIKRNFYFMTVPCQGFAFLLAVAHHYTDYKKWNLLGKGMAMMCLPIDVLIFYIEPIGFVETLIAMVMGFIPFAIIIADAIFPEKVVRIRGLKDKILTVHKNSWRRHISANYNKRYNLVLKRTAAGYSLFATVALVITLFQGDNFLPF